MTSVVSEQVWRGVHNLLDSYLELRAADRVVIAYTPDSRDAAAWVAVALQERGMPSAALVGMQPIVDDSFEARLLQALPAPADLPPGGRAVLLCLERDTMSQTDVVRRAMERYDACATTALRIINASPELFTHALNHTQADVSRLNAAVLNRLMGRHRLHIVSAQGTDLYAEIDSGRFSWISNRGRANPGGAAILPAGEVATYPAAIWGTLVADGAFNANVLTSLDARLTDHPVTVQIDDGMLADFECADPAVHRFIELCLTFPNSRRVGELGFGTNDRLPGMVAMNSHINERAAGVHIGFGQHNQSLERVPYDCMLHLDLIAPGVTVWIDKDPTPIEFSNLVPSDEPHPTDGVWDEDIVSDCCGLNRSDLSRHGGAVRFEPR